MTDRIVCCLTVSLLMGILFGKYGSFWFGAGFVLLLLYTGSRTVRICHQKAWKVILLRNGVYLLAFCSGTWHFQSEWKVRADLEHELERVQEQDQIVVQGKIHKKEMKTEQCLYYLTDTQVLVGDHVYPSYGILISSSEIHMQPGNLLRVSGRYVPFQSSRNEGNFNEKQYYQSKKIEFRLYAKEMVCLSEKENAYAVFLGNLRQKLKNVYLQCMSKQEAGLMAALTLGDKSVLDQEVKELYRQAGISHILAISGLHISLFGMGVFRLCRRCFCSDGISRLLAVGSVYSFGILSGMEISTFRAVCMFFLLMMAKTARCSYDSLTALGISGMIQLWENPFLTDYAGFLFSYGAVLGVVVIAGILRGERTALRENGGRETEERSHHRLWDMFGVNLCIQFAILPLSLWFYYEIPSYQILVNLCVLPVLGILLSLGVLGAFAGSYHLWAGRMILKPAGWILAGNQWICQRVLELPGALFQGGKPEIKLILFYYGILAMVLYLIWKGWGKKWLAVLGMALGLVLFLREGPCFEIHVLDVGQGDGIFIQTEEGRHFFIDGGSSDVDQVGTYRILPFLKARGISSVEGWIVSHGDQDHISGLEEVLKAGYSIKYLILAEGMVWDEKAEELAELAEKNGCRLLFVRPGMEFGAGKAVFTVWHPPAEGGEDQDRNGASLVVSLEYQGFTALFTGDIGTKQERQLIEERWMEGCGMEKIDCYKGAHHGSDHSNSLEFLEILSPQLTVLSCGEGNSYGHPGKEALERIKGTGSRVFCTMDQGQITIRPEKEKICVTRPCSCLAKHDVIYFMRRER
ncbi:MAG: DNA internalization-related competence protein ComEC/Rec2 [Lachnospiraceae bacterium]|nr:DNA internalization-related competence protein ComEC/Rec2 [Lachnospiraceae bacterium]